MLNEVILVKMYESPTNDGGMTGLLVEAGCQVSHAASFLLLDMFMFFCCSSTFSKFLMKI